MKNLYSFLIAKYKFLIKFLFLVVFIKLISTNDSHTYEDKYLMDYLEMKNNPSNLSNYYANLCSGNEINENVNLSPVFKIHVIYIHYLETKDVKSVENFKFFINFAYEPCSTMIHYTFILNTDSEFVDIFKELKSFLNDDIIDKMKFCKNTKFKYQLNEGNDICSFVKLTKSKYWKSKESEYQFYFYINSSVRGPFLPVYWTKPW